MRLDIYEGALFYIMKRIKPNYAELGRQYHCYPRTVKKYYEAGKENELERIKARKISYQSINTAKNTIKGIECIYGLYKKNRRSLQNYGFSPCRGISIMLAS